MCVQLSHSFYKEYLYIGTGIVDDAVPCKFYLLVLVPGYGRTKGMAVLNATRILVRVSVLKSEDDLHADVHLSTPNK